MSLSVGIVGFPNVGKSTLFNALLKKQQALAANYPFATIEPNVGIVGVPDSRLEKLAEVTAQEILKPFGLAQGGQVQGDRSKWPPIIPATVKFVDIAGLVKGAAEGAGLGNKFLSHIREVSIIAHVVRAFEDENIVKEGSVDPKSDYETIQTELMLADLQSLEKSKVPSGGKGQKEETIQKLTEALNEGIPARDVQLTDEEREEVKQLFLLTMKPEIVVLNVVEEALKDAEQITQNYAEILGVSKEQVVVISAQVESELAVLSEEEQKEYLKNLGLEQSGLERLIKKAYETLGLISFLTAGEKEVRAWTIRQGTKAADAAGVIHTDFSKHFIKAEVVSLEDFVNPPAGGGGWKKARELGKTRFEGRDYVVQDGDVIEFKVNV